MGYHEGEEEERVVMLVMGSGTVVSRGEGCQLFSSDQKGGLGFGVWGLGLGVRGLGFGVWCLVGDLELYTRCAK